MLKFPYAVREFKKMINGNYVYFDRTHAIPMIEEWGYELLFLRPRRFGKSLWLSIMMDYYDVAKADQFEHLFGKLAVGQNPTELHNQYMVMRWDFSKVKSHVSMDKIEEDLHTHINGHIRNFAQQYEYMLVKPIEINPKQSLDSFRSLLLSVTASSHQLYLFIDEYDNFANEVMMGDQGDNEERYLSLVKGEGMFKTFFKNIKGFGSGEGLDRVFITGVSPVVMNDLSSGANVFEDIYWYEEFNDLCGFHEHEVEWMVEEVIEEQGLYDGSEADRQAKKRDILDVMRDFYDGSWFTTEADPPPKPTPEQPEPDNGDDSRLYNPTMVFYFLRYVQRKGIYPRNMLDRNLQADKGKLAYLAKHATGTELLVDILNGEKEISIYDLSTEFGVKDMMSGELQHDRLISLMCYMGALTLDGTTPDGKLAFTIPNLVMRNLYAERISKMALPQSTLLHEGQVAADELFKYGNIKPLCQFIEANHMSFFSNRDYPQLKELTLKTLFLSLLYHNNLYVIDSEPELRRRYGDLLMLVRPGKRHFTIVDLLFEFKQVKLGQLEKKSDVEKEISDSEKSVPTYSGKEIAKMSQGELLKIGAVQSALNDAKTQLRDYQQILWSKYGEGLRLNTFAVVGVGFERLVWEKLD